MVTKNVTGKVTSGILLEVVLEDVFQGTLNRNVSMKLSNFSSRTSNIRFVERHVKVTSFSSIKD